MKRFELTDDLLTGIADIDEHHRILLELGNRVTAPAAVKADGAIFANALRFLSAYVIYHFTAEEYVMMEAAFPGYEHHRQWHDRFKYEILGYVDQASREGVSEELRLKISFAMENWLTEHIRISDRGLAEFLRQQKPGVPIHLPDISAFKELAKIPADLAKQSPDGTCSVF